MGVGQAHELLELPPLLMRVREFVALLTEKVYGVLCQGTKPISRQDVTQFVREFYALGKGQTRRVSPADRLRERYERDVKTHGIPVGEFKRHRLLDRARQKGLARLMYQVCLSAIVTNTKRLVRALEEQRGARKVE